MSGPQNCFVCANKFGLFRKQYDCNGCHRTACKGCLSHSITLPGQGTQSVCKYCHESTQHKPTNKGRVSPPANFKRELAKKEEMRGKEASNQIDPVDEQITDRLRKLKESYDRKDISVNEIQDRLQKLCAAEPSVSMEELEYRLAKLKGSRPPAIRVHSIRKRPSDNEPHSSKDTSEVKQVKRLIRQYTQEIELDTGGKRPTSSEMEENFHPDSVPTNPSTDDLIELARTELRREQEDDEDGMLQDEEIKRRLSQITEAPEVPIADETLGIESNFHFDEEGMDEETSRLIRQLMEEDRLEQNLREKGINLPPPGAKSTDRSKFGDNFSRATNSGDDKDEELPWCFMCNDDATTRCLTCEDLFCKTCFRVVHRDSDMKGHKTEKFVNKNASNV